VDDGGTLPFPAPAALDHFENILAVSGTITPELQVYSLNDLPAP
jgi:hypothetical protein